MLWDISETVNARAFNPLPLCSAPLKTYLYWFWSSRNKRRELGKQKFVLRKCCGVSQKWWMPELSTLSHCVQYPWKLACRDFWSSTNKRKSLSKQIYVLSKCCGVPRKWWRLELYIFAIVLSTHENLPVGISWAQGMKGSLFLSKNVFWENAAGYCWNGEC